MTSPVPSDPTRGCATLTPHGHPDGLVALEAGLRAAGLLTGPLTLVRARTRLHLAAPADGRWFIAAPAATRTRVALEASWAGRLAALMQPAGALLELDAPGLVVAPYRLYHPSGPATPALLGTLLGALHDEAGRTAVGPITSAALVADQLGAARAGGTLPDRDHARLTARLEASLTELRCDPGPLGWGLIHGDAHLANVLAADPPVLCDLESLGVGPRVLDLAPLLVEHRRYGGPERDVTALAEAYAHATHRRWDPAADAALDAAVRYYELVVTAWALACAVEDPSLHPEAALRLAGVLGGDRTPWTRR